MQHSGGVKHRKLANEMATQQTLVNVPLTSAAQLPSGGPVSAIRLHVHGDEVLKAEVLWCLQLAKSNFYSCEGITNTFQAMFSSDISKDLQLSRTMVSYTISDGLRPYFNRELVLEVNRSKLPFVVHYDETTQAQTVKQLNVHFRYWSNMKNEVCVRFYKALMFGHAEGALVADKMLQVLEAVGVLVSNLLTLASDGPGVNETIWRKIQKDLTDAGHGDLVEVGTCNTHVRHNAFHYVVNKFGSDVEELTIDLHTFFKLSAARREDFHAVQLSI